MLFAASGREDISLRDTDYYGREVLLHLIDGQGQQAVGVVAIPGAPVVAPGVIDGNVFLTIRGEDRLYRVSVCPDNRSGSVVIAAHCHGMSC